MTLLPIFLPDPIYQTDYAALQDNPQIQHMGFMEYSGTVFSIVAALGIMALIAGRYQARHSRPTSG